ncbi:MAG: hypothetical protein ACKPJD_30170, partial [Planctomycetaceae bacterium]
CGCCCCWVFCWVLPCGWYSDRCCPAISGLSAAGVSVSMVSVSGESDLLPAGFLRGKSGRLSERFLSFVCQPSEGLEFPALSGTIRGRSVPGSAVYAS